MSAQRSIPARFGSSLTLAALMLWSTTPAQAQATRTAPVKPQEKATAKEKAAAKTKAAAEPIDVNSASAEDLMTLPGVGEAISKKIIDGRPYKTLDDLTAKAGVPAATVAKLKGQAIARPMPSPVDVNTATADRLQTLPGVGPALAKAIVAGRPYKSFDDLAKVKGLGPAKLETLRGRVDFGKAATPLNAPKNSADSSKKNSATPKEKSKTDTDTPAAPTSPKSSSKFTKKSTEPGAKMEKADAEKKAASKEKSTAKAKLPPGQKININTATAEQLDELFGIGPVRARAIIDGRPYKSIEDVMKVKGIKEGEFSKIKDQITVK